MNQETKICQNCKKDFVIGADDFDFYEKIKVPVATWCHDCKMQRRFLWRNERNFYKRECGLCKASIISMYSADKPFPVFCNNCWYSDKWDPMEFGRDYDFNKNFFAQIGSLTEKVARPSLIGTKNVESPYVNYSARLKNCYFLVGSSDDKDCSYAYRTFDSQESLDLFGLVDSNQCYECVQTFKSSKAYFTRDCEQLVDCILMYDCKNCHDCVGCAGLRNKSYCIFNQQYSQEDYKTKIEELELDRYTGIKNASRKLQEILLKYPRRFSKILLSKDSNGDDLKEVKYCEHCFVLRESEQVKYSAFGSGLKDSQDVSFADDAELCYESSNIEQNYKKYFSLTCWFSKDMEYCELCFNCTNCFGCIGLQKKSYCIFNKQYTKEEYEALMPKIIEHMNLMPYIDKNGRVYKYGEFFPAELSPFAYNETIAQEYFPLIKEQILENGFKWKDSEERNYTINIRTEDISDSINKISEDTAGKIIECEHKGKCNEQCTSAFKITTQELQFYKMIKLPLPRLCPNCRHYQRLGQRNPLKLWHRSCMKPGCANEFETSYAPDRSEIVYCEQCYQQEVA